MVAPQGANGAHLSDPISCKTPGRDNDSKLDLPPGRPSLITRVCEVDSYHFRVEQGRRSVLSQSFPPIFLGSVANFSQS